MTQSNPIDTSTPKVCRSHGKALWLRGSLPNLIPMMISYRLLEKYIYIYMLFHIYLLKLYDNYYIYIIYIYYILYVSNQHHVGLGCQCHQVKSAADMEVMFDMSKKEQVSGRHSADPAREL
jgi:hypothetical protein